MDLVQWLRCPAPSTDGSAASRLWIARAWRASARDAREPIGHATVGRAMPQRTDVGQHPLDWAFAQPLAGVCAAPGAPAALAPTSAVLHDM